MGFFFELQLTFPEGVVDSVLKRKDSAGERTAVD